jgi:Acyl-CoA dehydrogenase, N-terminal domain/Acyl-CoA dehydrogenase, middle domain
MTSTYDISFAPPPAVPGIDVLRREVRAFLAEALKDRTAGERAESWIGHDPAFSRAVGARGWIGMTWPKEYGGHERSALERYVVIEEMLAAGAPVNAHWIADRQSGPALLRYGTEQQRLDILPRIARGECQFGIGMSEPDSGSDLASARTRAVETAEGWVVNGTKLWTSGAHQSDYIILFCKTDGNEGDRHGGASQFLVDMRGTRGIEVRPVQALTGEHHFNEVVFRDALLPRDALLGRRGDGWAQVMSELAYERSGPERFLSSFQVVIELLRRLGPTPDTASAAAIGRIVARIAGMLQAGQDPGLQAAIVKDLGAMLEQQIPEIARTIVSVQPDLASEDGLEAALAYTIQHAPSFSLRGGTREILRGIIARGVGMR